MWRDGPAFFLFTVRAICCSDGCSAWAFSSGRGTPSLRQASFTWGRSSRN